EELSNDRFGRREAEKGRKAQQVRKHRRYIAKMHAWMVSARAGLQIKLVLDLMRRFEFVTVGNACLETRQNEEAEERLRRILVVLPQQAPATRRSHTDRVINGGFTDPIRRAVHKTKRCNPKLPQHGE